MEKYIILGKVRLWDLSAVVPTFLGCGALANQKQILGALWWPLVLGNNLKKIQDTWVFLGALVGKHWNLLRPYAYFVLCKSHGHFLIEIWFTVNWDQRALAQIGPKTFVLGFLA